MKRLWFDSKQKIQVSGTLVTPTQTPGPPPKFVPTTTSDPLNVNLTSTSTPHGHNFGEECAKDSSCPEDVKKTIIEIIQDLIRRGGKPNNNPFEDFVPPPQEGNYTNESNKVR